MKGNDLGPVSAYALAVVHGFEGTEEEWAVLQAQAGQNAQAAAESAQAAADDRAAVEALVQEIANKQQEAITAIVEKGQETIETIPEDYSKLYETVTDLAAVPYEWMQGYFVSAQNGLVLQSDKYKCTDFVPLWRNGVFFPVAFAMKVPNTMGVSLYDEKKNMLRTITVDDGVNTLTEIKGVVTANDGAYYLRASTWAEYDAQLVYTDMGGIVVKHPTSGTGEIDTDKIADAAVTPEKTSFIKEFVGANLFDKDTMVTIGSWYYWAISANTGEGKPVALAANEYTAKYGAVEIPVSKAGPITIKQIDGVLYGYWCVNDTNICTAEYGVGLSVNLRDGYTINVPDGATKVLLSISNYVYTQFDLMAAYGTEAKDYEPYTNYKYLDGIRTEVVTLKTKLELPSEYALVVGDTFELFYKGIVNAVNPDVYDVVLDCAKGNAYSKRYIWTPTAADVGRHELTVTLYDGNHSVLDKKIVYLEVQAKATTPISAVNVLYVGDSLATGGAVPAEMKRRLTGTGGTPAADGISNIQFIGSCENMAKTVRYEGYGGWSFNSYNTENKSSQYMWITCLDHGKTEADDQHSVYADANGVNWKLETIETGRIKLIRTSASGTLPASGTLTWVSGGVHTGNIVYTASEQAAGNPFWDESTAKVDFATYAQRMGVDKIDYVYVLLGWNNANNSEDDYKALVRTFVGNVLASFPDCKIVLLGLQLPARDGLGVNYGAAGVYSRYYDMMQHVWNLNHWYADIAAEYPDNVKAVNIAGQFDTEHNMQSSTRTVNVRSTVTETYQTNGVHPAHDGYMQIADACYRDFVHRLHG